MIVLRDGEASLDKIQLAVETAIQNTAYHVAGQQIGPVVSSIVREAVMAGIRELIEQQYTDTDFEKDMNL